MIGNYFACDSKVDVAGVDPTLGVISPLCRSLQTWQSLWPGRQCIVTDAVREYSAAKTVILNSHGILSDSMLDQCISTTYCHFENSSNSVA